MKKIGIGFRVTLFAVITFILLPYYVSAATMPEEVDGKITLEEDVKLSETFVVKNGEEIVLNLNGHTLDTISGDTIYVELGGKLTITGDGTVTNNIHAKAPLFNNGTTIIDGATLTRNDVSKSNTYYVILNHGVMTIKDATVTNPSVYSSLVANGYYSFTSSNERNGYVAGINQEEPTLTIEDGMFDGGMNTIKNDDNSKLVINGGTFQNSYQVAIMNYNEAEINGGTFKVVTGLDKTTIFVGNNGANSVDKGILVINGGVFEAEQIIEGEVCTPVEINNGTFKYTTSFFNSSTTISKDDVVVVGGTYTTDELISSVEDDEKELVVTEDGSYLVQYKDADYSKVNELLEKAKAIDTSKYTSESVKRLTDAINAVITGKKINEQASVDEMANNILTSINSLKEQEPEINNPDTHDGINKYLGLSLLSITGIMAVILYSKKSKA